ncbi:patatin-like protein 5 [Primulina tabacum]|uniref:patatin-like protein 5 n=1 Tax=Primulina tabacum TaxID=48773 RepID=UPI003F59FD0C
MSMGLEHALDGKKLLVLSLGTGIAQSVGRKYKAREAANWGVVGWVYNEGVTPLIEASQDASSDMVDIHIFTLFQLLGNEENYLCIQEDRLTGDATLLDVSTNLNLQNLVQLGKSLLKKPVSWFNLETGTAEPVQGEGTNEVALIRLAKWLSEEKKARSR